MILKYQVKGIKKILNVTGNVHAYRSVSIFPITPGLFEDT